MDLNKKTKKTVLRMVDALLDDFGDDLPEYLLELWTDLDDYEDLEESPEVLHVVGYVQGVADQAEKSVEDVLKESGVDLEEDDDEDEDDEDEEEEAN